LAFAVQQQMRVLARINDLTAQLGKVDQPPKPTGRPACARRGAPVTLTPFSCAGGFGAGLMTVLVPLTEKEKQALPSTRLNKDQ
jgi:hypothetical protein